MFNISFFEQALKTLELKVSSHIYEYFSYCQVESTEKKYLTKIHRYNTNFSNIMILLTIKQQYFHTERIVDIFVYRKTHK